MLRELPEDNLDLSSTARREDRLNALDWPSLGVILGFGAAFFFLMQVLKVMPLGVTYALWSGLGICLTVFLGWLVFNQKVDLPAFLGLSMIVGGIVVINLFSSTATH